MKKALLLGAGLVAPCLAVSAASATPIDLTFDYTGKIVDVLVAESGTYLITAEGAEGGAGEDATGGLGALVCGDFTLTSGEKLQIAVGGMGAASKTGVGGGGGSFVVAGPPKKPADDTVLGGGGGGGGTSAVGQGGLTTKSGGAGGKGGLAGAGVDAGAGGYKSPGQNGPNGGGGGGSFRVSGGSLAGGAGEANLGGAGRFGGGGAYGGGGGGGGYSGGGGGGGGGDALGAPGGGGSILREASNGRLLPDDNAGDGYVIMIMEKATATAVADPPLDSASLDQVTAVADLAADAPDPVPEPG